MSRLLLTLLALSLSLSASDAFAQMGAPPPAPVPVATPAEPDAIPLYPDEGKGNTELWAKFMGTDLVVRNVTRPTLTPFLPDPAKANGAAVIVAPGGAFMLLAMEHEGWSVAKALADRGIAAFVLKYRLIATPADDMAAHAFMGEMMAKELGSPMEGPLMKQSLAPADAKAALAMVRTNAAKWKIDPKRVGMIGFSAGAMTSRRAALDADPSARPAFVGYIYGPQQAEPVPADAPPLFNAIALDDPLFPFKGFPIAEAWYAANRSVEVHAYQTGGHGFGLGRAGTTTTGVLDQFVAWLDMNGFLQKQEPK